ncbi:MAG: hypothetical protein NZ853_09720 [Leptospiraceae bacterium]|nr:hypothetical protein [Leptospiraceae bacterium]MDW7976973.1 MBOAT family O-acyltransferase [Leptospiraceae bacterium]
MLFVTIEYLVFFIVVFFLFWSLPARFRFWVLLVSSFYFYGTWSIPFLFHLILIVAINYYGMELWRVYKQKFIFVFIMIIDILNIAIFKYFYLLLDVLGHLLQIPILRHHQVEEIFDVMGLKIFLPLGISFYTFQIMSYSYDVFSGRYDKRHPFREVLLYILFFPQLIAGPIMRAEELLPQIQNIKKLSFPTKENLEKGFWLILIGVVKKLLIADILASVIAPLHDNQQTLSTGDAWLLVFSSLLMLYADFSAYSDIARGCGLFLGIHIPINFRAPFFMVSHSDFWRRWHLTFSMWIRDYIYIPLGGSKVPELRHYGNLILTFFLGGLWHGASYNFIFWGVFVGLSLSIESFLFRRGLSEVPKSLLSKILRRFITWLIFLPQTTFFFVKDIDRALYVLEKMLTFDFQGISLNTEIIFFSTLSVLVFQFFEEYPEKLERFRKYSFFLQMVFFVIVIFLLLEFSKTGQDFFYFQF